MEVTVNHTGVNKVLTQEQFSLSCVCAALTGFGLALLRLGGDL